MNSKRNGGHRLRRPPLSPEFLDLPPTSLNVEVRVKSDAILIDNASCGLASVVKKFGTVCRKMEVLSVHPMMAVLDQILSGDLEERVIDRFAVADVRGLTVLLHVDEPEKRQVCRLKQEPAECVGVFVEVTFTPIIRHTSKRQPHTASEAPPDEFPIHRLDLGVRVRKHFSRITAGVSVEIYRVPFPDPRAFNRNPQPRNRDNYPALPLRDAPYSHNGSFRWVELPAATLTQFGSYVKQMFMSRLNLAMSKWNDFGAQARRSRYCASQWSSAAFEKVGRHAGRQFRADQVGLCVEDRQVNVLHTREFRLPEYRSGEIPSGDVAGAEIGAGKIPIAKIPRRVNAGLFQNFHYFSAAFRKENDHLFFRGVARNRHVLHSSK